MAGGRRCRRDGDLSRTTPDTARQSGAGLRGGRGSGGVYANFPDTDLSDQHRAYWGDNLERVRRVKEKYDPEAVFG